jgi:hypothetical protein
MATATELTVGAKVWRKGQPSEALVRHRERGCCQAIARDRLAPQQLADESE